MTNLLIFKFDRMAFLKIALSVLFFFSTGNFAEQIIPNSLSYIHQVVVLLVVWSVIICLVVGYFRLPTPSWSQNSLVFIYLAFIAWVFISLFWSNLDGGVLARSFAFLSTTVFAFILAGLISVHTYFRLLFKVQLSLLFISLFVVFIVPSVGVDSGAHEGAWKGVFSQKNSFGRAVAFCGLIGMMLYFSGVQRMSISMPRLILLYLVCAFILLASDSKTSLILLSVFPFILIIFRFGERFLRSFIIRLGVLTLISGVLLYFFNSDDVFLGNVSSANDYISLFGIEIPLTGRATLWAYVHHNIIYYDKYWFGFGYDGFWGHDFSVMYRWGLGEFEANDSHNGFLDTFLQLGLVGLLLLYTCLSLIFLKSLSLSTTAQLGARGYGRVVLIFVIFMCLFNLTESTFLKSTNIMQFTLSFLFFSLLFRTGREQSVEVKIDKRDFS